MPIRLDNKFSLEAKLALVRAGLSVTKLAVKIGRPRQTVNSVICGITRFPRVRKQVAEALNISIS